MNPNNYTSLELSQRLVAAGIVLETVLYWDKVPVRLDDWGGEKHYVLSTKGNLLSIGIPAPSMSELWRELLSICSVCLSGQQDGMTTAWAYSGGRPLSPDISNTNPCDCLAELLIWVKGERG